MKTLLIDAWNTFVTEKGIDQNILSLCESIACPKIIVTNANNEEKIRFGIVDMPYEVFSLEHNPNKTDPLYFEILLKKYSLHPEDVLYVEHNLEAIISARSLGIETYYFDKDARDYDVLQLFLKTHI